MSWRRYLRRRWWDQEREREIDAYLETETAENVARGMTRDEAEAAARRKFGSFALVREEIYSPALRAARTDPGAAMKSGARGMTADRGRFGLRRALVAAQIAVSLVLLVGALLFVRSFNNLLTFDTGFQQEGILETDVDFRSLNSSDERLVAVRHGLLRHLRAIPGVEAAASTAIVPIAGDSWHQYVYLDSPRGEIQYLYTYSQVSSDYFRTLRTPLLSGRDFDDHDTPASPRVAIISESFARRFLAGKKPAGAVFRKDLAPGRQAVYQIVVLVKDTIYDDLREGFGPIAYLATSQDSSPGQYDQVLLRSNLPPAGLKGPVSTFTSSRSRSGAPWSESV